MTQAIISQQDCQIGRLEASKGLSYGQYCILSDVLRTVIALYVKKY